VVSTTDARARSSGRDPQSVPQVRRAGRRGCRFGTTRRRRAGRRSGARCARRRRTWSSAAIEIGESGWYRQRTLELEDVHSNWQSRGKSVAHSGDAVRLAAEQTSFVTTGRSLERVGPDISRRPLNRFTVGPIGRVGMAWGRRGHPHVARSRSLSPASATPATTAVETRPEAAPKPADAPGQDSRCCCCERSPSSSGGAGLEVSNPAHC
jgi:hypothetical protein